MGASRPAINSEVFQTVGGAVFVAAAQSAFVNQLIIHLTTIVSDIDSGLVVATGAVV